MPSKRRQRCVCLWFVRLVFDFFCSFGFFPIFCFFVFLVWPATQFSHFFFFSFSYFLLESPRETTYTHMNTYIHHHNHRHYHDDDDDDDGDDDKIIQARAQEEEERRKRRQLQKQYQKELAEQVAGREHLYHYVGRVRKRKYASMSDREKALNKSLIKEIRMKAPELLSPIKSPPKASEEEEEYSSGIY